MDYSDLIERVSGHIECIEAGGLYFCVYTSEFLTSVHGAISERNAEPDQLHRLEVLAERLGDLKPRAWRPQIPVTGSDIRAGRR